MTNELKSSLNNLREKFDNLLLKEIEVFGGIPTMSGRLMKETNELREAIAELLEIEMKESNDK